MSTPFTLTLPDVLAKVRRAYREGRLGFQMPNVHRLGCYYRYPDRVHGCAIGVALPSDLLDRIEAVGGLGWALGDLLAEGIVAASDQDRTALRRLQFLHDRLCSVTRSPDDKANDLAEFQALIELGREVAA